MGISKKWFLIFFTAVFLVGLLIFATRTLNSFQRSGELQLKGLKSSARVVRDIKGMAYVYAENEDDLFFMQGFVSAQDRLFNMEVLRRLATGRLSEVFGEGALKSDRKMRTIGFLHQAKKQAILLNERDHKRFQRFVDGINSFIENCSDDIPLEMKLVGMKPEKWNVSDSLAIVYYMGWGSSANLKTEIVAQLLIDKLGIEKAQKLFPLNFNPDDPTGQPLPVRTPGQSSSKFSSSSLAELASLVDNNHLKIGSNNWVVGSGLSSGNKPMLANDPHLTATVLPGPFYPVGLITPELRAVGVTVNGIPGLIVGRNDHIAFGVTNGYGDMQDLYVETVSKQNPSHYLADGRSFPFDIREEEILVKDKSTDSGFRSEMVNVKLTPRGPVVSYTMAELPEDKVFTLRWSPFESMQPSTGLMDLLTAKDIHEARTALSNITAIMLNFVLADTKGNIAWQTTGRIPIRSQNDGTVPYLVKNNEDNWLGWIPWDKMPNSINPGKGWVGTANHTTVTGDYPYYFSSHFSPSWRYSRLKQLMGKNEQKSVEDHWKFQRDTKNLMAERLVPIFIDVLKTNPKTAFLGKELENWDFEDDPALVAPTIYQTLMVEVLKATLMDELGEDAFLVYGDVWYFWQERLVEILEGDNQEWFDDVTTASKKETRKDIVIKAGMNTVKYLADEFGSNPNLWTWGKSHQIEFVSILRRSGFGKQLLGGGSYPMPGSGETLYRGVYLFNKPFKTHIPAALRMVVDLADNDKVLAVLPGGVSARILDPHRTDQIKSYMDGKIEYWWFSDEKIEENAGDVLRVLPVLN